MFYICLCEGCDFVFIDSVGSEWVVIVSYLLVEYYFGGCVLGKMIMCEIGVDGKIWLVCIVGVVDDMF